MKKYLMAIMLFFLSLSFGFAQVSFDKKAVLKSLVLPGWGEVDYNSSRSKLFLKTDASMLLAYISSKVYKNIRHNDLINYATQYSNASVLYDINNQYLVDIGAFLSYEDHKKLMLENRTPEKIYDDKYSWEWDSLDKANTYRNIRVNRDVADHYASLLIGAMVFNRILSAIDVIYLSNMSQSMSAYVSKEQTVTQINFSLQF